MWQMDLASFVLGKLAFGLLLFFHAGFHFVQLFLQLGNCKPVIVDLVL